MEELEEERRRSLETGVARAALDTSDNNNEPKFEGSEPAKPPQGDNNKKTDRRKKSKEDKSESHLFRRPSMKKIKEFFDKDKNKENRDNESQAGEDNVSGSVAHRLAFSREYESAVAKMPSLETSGGFFSSDTVADDKMTGQSKSVPSSLDRKQRYKQDPDPEQVAPLPVSYKQTF